MFKISDFSKLSRVSVKTLRFYDQIGSLKPQHTDEHSGYRYYTADQLYRLHRILAFKDLGFTLEQIGSMLDEVSCAEIQGMLRLKRAELHKKVLEEQARLARIEARVLQIEQEDGSAPLTDPVVKTLEPQHVASVRERVPRAHLGLLLKDIKRYAREQGIASIPFAIRWHDCSASDETADLEVAVALTREAPGGGRVQVGEWPEAPLMATLVHKCDPHSVCRATSDLAHWIERNGYRISDSRPSRELFYPAEGEGEKGLHLAELQMPVELAIG
ncbi:MerR family transcriptional regulator [Paenibacillus sp. P26]|nr:MerR family transcriptional regulator [Paenibacillus sp. P26]